MGFITRWQNAIDELEVAHRMDILQTKTVRLKEIEKLESRLSRIKSWYRRSLKK